MVTGDYIAGYFITLAEDPRVNLVRPYFLCIQLELFTVFTILWNRYLTTEVVLARVDYRRWVQYDAVILILLTITSLAKYWTLQNTTIYLSTTVAVLKFAVEYSIKQVFWEFFVPYGHTAQKLYMRSHIMFSYVEKHTPKICEFLVEKL